MNLTYIQKMADVSLVGWREQGYEEEMQLLREEKEGCPF